MIATAVAVPVVVGLALVGVLVVGGGSTSDDVAASTPAGRPAGPPAPLTTTVPAPDTTTEATCAPVLAGMPVQIVAGDGSVLAPVRVTPGGPTFLAWGDSTGTLVTLQCGVGRPAQLRSDNPFNPILLAPVKAGTDDSGGGADGGGAVAWAVDEGSPASIWTTIDRSVYLRVVAPSADYVQEISEIIGANLPPVCQATTETTGGPDGTGVIADCGDRP